MKLAITILSSFLFACTAQTADKPQASKRDAGRALATASALLDSIDTNTVVNGLLPASTATVDFSEPCPTSGSIELDGTFETSDGGRTDLDVTAGFLGCATGSEQIDGTLHWTQTVDGGDYTSLFDGTLTWQGPGGSASCSFDIAVNNGTVTGTACGYDVGELDQ